MSPSDVMLTGEFTVYSGLCSSVGLLNVSALTEVSLLIAGSKDYQLVTWSRDQTLRIWRVDPQLQKVSAQPQRSVQTHLFSWPDLFWWLVVVVQLCVSDVVEDLMEGMSLNVESEKSSQEPQTQHSVGPAAENLQGETETYQHNRFERCFWPFRLCIYCTICTVQQLRIISL